MELETIYGIGVGPGDPRLLTLRAAEVLCEVGAVLVPRSRHDRDSLALSIARPHLSPDCDIMEIVFPMTEDRAVLEKAWRDAADIMIDAAGTGMPVAFLTLGDAMLYSTWSYLLRTIQRLRPGTPIETIPGITAMSACAAAMGVPLAEGRDPLLVWPDEPPADTAALLDIAPNLVFMKAARHLHQLAALPDAEVTAVRRVTLPEEQVTRDLSALASEKDYFTTVIVHKKRLTV